MSDCNLLISHLIWKGGGGHIGHHIHIGTLTRLRHHPWTGTTDKVPRTDGTGGGLNDGMEPTNKKDRVKNWAKFIAKQIKKEVGFVKERVTRKPQGAKGDLDGK